MTGKRDYGQFCGLAAGLNVVGERWTLLILRELMIGPARFNELIDNLPGIGPNLLADRLRTLADQGVIEQTAVAGDGRGKLYRLTELGWGLRAPILALARWGLQFLAEDDATGAVRAEWGFLAVQAMIADDRIPEADEVYEFRVGDQVFAVHVEGGSVSFSRGPADSPDLVVTSDPDTFVRIGARMLAPFDAVVAGDIKIEGEPEVMHRCTGMLGLS
ncbi:winged helix-turn-helix transcriptional regulator [Saccharopolyspora sp. CA-218241]|uniref:winged helix-turn-helix transcriptional regulator n=1 Tax=Saccharopolyspora sp. CA-218241 TaxID=3240027 RepID=UPI003D99B460